MSTGSTVYFQNDMDSPSVPELWRNSHSGYIPCPMKGAALLGDQNNHMNGGHHSFGKESIKKKRGQTNSLCQTGPTGVPRCDVNT